MKKTEGNNIRLGVFVFTGSALFIIGIYFIGQKQQMFANTFHISGIFKDISGLQIGNNVRFSGIDVGVIDDIEQITDSTVRVDMLINESTRKFIKKNAKAIIGSDGLMGNKILLIMPGTGNNQQVIANNDIIQTAQPVSMDDLLIKLKVTGDNAATITSDLATIVGNIRDGKGTMGKLFMDSTFAKNVEESVVNIKQGTGGFKKNMDAASHNILLRGYLKKKQNQAEKQVEKQQEKKEDKK
jgi:phospholipid/cholesterol/gamma-HCH transport system substrate-binding protein